MDSEQSRQGAAAVVLEGVKNGPQRSIVRTDGATPANHRRVINATLTDAGAIRVERERPPRKERFAAAIA
jgi:hypothetical protein